MTAPIPSPAHSQPERAAARAAWQTQAWAAQLPPHSFPALPVPAMKPANLPQRAAQPALVQRHPSRSTADPYQENRDQENRGWENSAGQMDFWARPCVATLPDKNILVPVSKLYRLGLTVKVWHPRMQTQTAAVGAWAANGRGKLLRPDKVAYGSGVLNRQRP